MINEFRGKYRFLSNFWPCQVTFEEEVYPSVEHAYQAAKCFWFQDRKHILNCKTPGEAKKLGRRVATRLNWEHIKVDVMFSLLKEKFKDPLLATWLLATGSQELQEGNWWSDTFWGVDQRTGKGENCLGKLLMQVRSGLENKGA